MSSVDEPQSEIRVGAETDVTVDPALEATVITTPKNDHKNRHQVQSYKSFYVRNLRNLRLLVLW